MRTAFRRLLAATLTSAVLLGVAWGSVSPLRVAGADDAILRISLGARPERIEICREQSNEELAKLAPQMRQSVICEGTTARYRLQVRRNGELLHSQEVRGGGLRHDRQLYVSRDLRVPVGPAAFAVHLVRIDTVANDERHDQRSQERDDDDGDRRAAGDDVSLPGGAMPARATREADERRRRREESVPADLRLELDATLQPREVLLVTYDPERHRLTTVRASSLPRR